MTILLGGGQNSEIIRGITKESPFYNRKIDMVIVPSAVPAQIGGLVEVIERYEVKEIIMSKIIATSSVLTQLMKQVRKKKIHVKEVEKGDEMEIEPGVKLDVLFPYNNFKFNKTSLPELGFFLKYKNTGVFLLGNLSKTIQKDIAKNIEIETDQNIVEFYNSMADGKNSDELIEKINPRYTFSTKEKSVKYISDGEEWRGIK